MKRIRVLVLSEMPEGEQNVLWHLFSGVQEKVVSGAAQYRQHTGEMSSIINQLFKNYQLEGLVMPYTMEDFRRDIAREYLDSLTPNEVLQRFSLEERLQGLSVDEILQRFPLDEVLQRFPLEEIRA